MTKVLVVDDSALMRRTLGQLLSDAGMQVETARNGREAVERLLECEPDVVTLDVHMPDMDGLTSLSLMMQVRPTPVVMVSSVTEDGALATLEALALGAVDCVAKPGGTISRNLAQVGGEIVRKVQAAAAAQVSPAQRRRLHRMASSARRTTTTRPCHPRPSVADHPAAAPAEPAGMPEGLVLIGVSTGGPRTLEEVLPRLPADFPWPVLVAQHMPASFTQVLAQRMDHLCALHVVEVDHPMPVRAGTVYVARGGSDLVLTRMAGGLYARPVPESPEHVWHPSVSRLVDSALHYLGAQRLVGVLLTGMGSDGAGPMARLHSEGGRTIAESRESAVVFGMPQELIALGGASVVRPSHEVAPQLCEWLLPA